MPSHAERELHWMDLPLDGAALTAASGRLTGAERLSLANQMTDDARNALAARVRNTFPGWSENAVHREMCRRFFLGELEHLEAVPPRGLADWIAESRQGGRVAPSWFITTQRLGFRTWSLMDLPFARALWGDPAVTRLTDSRGQLTEAQVRERLEKEIANQTTHGVQYWPIFVLATGEFVGCCGLRPYNPADRVFEFGVHIRPAFWGNGIATEGGRAVIDHAFNRLGQAALFAGHHPKNDASRRMLLILGFKHTRDEFYAPTGLMHQSYGIDKAEHLLGDGAEHVEEPPEASPRD